MHSFKPLSTVPSGHEQPALQLSDKWHCFKQVKVEHDKSQELIHELKIFPFVQF